MSNDPYQSTETVAAAQPVPPNAAYATTLTGNPVEDIMAPLVGVKKWMKLVGIMNIIVGGLYCATIVGAIVGWLPLWIGIVLTKASDKLSTGQILDYRESTQNIATYFSILGVLTLVSLILSGVMIVLMLVVGIFAGVSSSGAGY